jgi:subtilase family serine protease
MGDIVTALSNFGKTSQAWTPPTPFDHDLEVILSLPLAINITETPTVDITAIVRNKGLSNEPSVTLKIIINGTEVATWTGSLASGGSHTLTYSWTPEFTGNKALFIVTAQAPAVPGETYTINNQVTSTVNAVK